MAGENTRRSETGAGLRGRDKQQDDLRDRDKGQGVVRDERGQEQPADKRRAQQNSRGQQSAGVRAQKAAAEDDTPSPGEPARGE
ncbi:MAG: hypothetical protein K2Y27_03810 [Xanthobacteraceae bacterium]|nr:hypothetical protein [Xanthobacteraceae bacterium]